jgi:hypothetical protein
MRLTTRCALVIVGTAAASLAALATAAQDMDVESECRNEAEMYEIPDEQRADYVSGCVMSRGGSVAAEDPAPDGQSDAGETEYEEAGTSEDSGVDPSAPAY